MISLILVACGSSAENEDNDKDLADQAKTD